MTYGQVMGTLHDGYNYIGIVWYPNEISNHSALINISYS